MTTIVVPADTDQEDWYEAQAVNLAIASEIRFWQQHAVRRVTDYSVPRKAAWRLGIYYRRYTYTIQGDNGFYIARMRDEYGYGYGAHGVSAKRAYQRMWHVARLHRAAADWKHDKRGQRIIV